MWETSACVLGVVICILEIGQCQELPLLFQVIQWKFCGITGNFFLLNRQMIFTVLFSILNYVANLCILTIVCISLNLVFQALPWCEAFIKPPPHICLCRCCLPKHGYIQQGSGKNLFGFGFILITVLQGCELCSVMLCFGEFFKSLLFLYQQNQSRNRVRFGSSEEDTVI